MNLSLIDDIEERQKELDRERSEARQIVIAEIQSVINRLSIRSDELKFSVLKTRKPRRQKRATEL